MDDRLAELAVRLKRLLDQAMTENNPEVYDKRCAELWHIVEERARLIEQPSAPEQKMVRCPYCTEGNNGKVMADRFGGAWFRCDRCGHVVMPGDEEFQCSCLNCRNLPLR